MLQMQYKYNENKKTTKAYNNNPQIPITQYKLFSIQHLFYTGTPPLDGLCCKLNINTMKKKAYNNNL